MNEKTRTTTVTTVIPPDMEWVGIATPYGSLESHQVFALVTQTVEDIDPSGEGEAFPSLFSRVSVIYVEHDGTMSKPEPIGIFDRMSKPTVRVLGGDPATARHRAMQAKDEVAEQRTRRDADRASRA
jgi:hypothetical protein